MQNKKLKLKFAEVYHMPVGAYSILSVLSYSMSGSKKTYIEDVVALE